MGGNIHAVEDMLGFGFRIDADTGIAPARSRKPERLIACYVFHSVGQLFRRCLYLLQADGIGVKFMDDVDKAFFFKGAQAVYIPRDKLLHVIIFISALPAAPSWE